MKYRIIKILNTHKILIDNKLVSIIKNKLNCINIYNQDSKLLFNILNKGLHLIKVEGDSFNSLLEIKLSEDFNITRPACGVSIKFDYHKNEYILKQDNKREFTIFQNGLIAGNIKNILKRNTYIETTKDIDDKVLYLLYGLSIRMLKEDDIDIV